MQGTLPADPATPTLIAFTSGHHSDPKGVIHSHQSLGFETRQLLENYPPGRGRLLTALPVGHFIGMLGAFLIPVIEGTDRPVRCLGPRRAIDLMESDGVALGGGLLFRHQPARPPAIHRRPPPVHQVPRPRGIDRSSRGHAATGRPRHPRPPLLWQQRTPVDHRLTLDCAGRQASFTDGEARRAWRSGWPTTAKSSVVDRICVSVTPTRR